MATSVASQAAGTAEPADPVLKNAEFADIRKLAYEQAGISLSDAKKALVESRLRKRVRATGCSSYRAYFELITGGSAPDELQTAIDLLTTNETYFFREQQHFDHLRDRVLRQRKPGSAKLRLWSAACSSGEEPYSVAMLLAATIGFGGWEILASDLSTQVLARAQLGHYPLTRARGVKPEYLRDYCMRGTGRQEGSLLVNRQLRQCVQFMHLNLIEPLPDVGKFDVILLRNVMIYFDGPTKRRVVESLVPRLVPGGFFYIGHSETLNGVTDVLRQVAPAIYCKGT